MWTTGQPIVWYRKGDLREKMGGDRMGKPKEVLVVLLNVRDSVVAPRDTSQILTSQILYSVLGRD